MKPKGEILSWLLAILSVPIWVFSTSILVLILTSPDSERVRIAAAEGNPQPGNWGWLAAFLAVMALGWVGEVTLWTLLFRYRGRPRPARARGAAVLCFCAATALFVALVLLKVPDWVEFALNAFCVLGPLGLGGTAALLLPVTRRGEGQE
jgi:hypothetical protein